MQNHSYENEFPIEEENNCEYIFILLKKCVSLSFFKSHFKEFIFLFFLVFMALDDRKYFVLLCFKLVS